MNKEEFILSISNRLTQLKARTHMEWHTTQSLQDSLDTLRNAIFSYVETRPEYKTDMVDYLEAIDELEKEIY